MRQRTIWVGGFAAAIILLAGVTYLLFLQPPTVLVATPTRGLAVEAVYATGTVEPIRYARVGTKVSGRLTEVVAREGAPVEAGQVLAVIDAREEISRVQELSARLQLAASELERTRTLRRAGHVSAAVLDQMETAHAAALAALKGAQARLDEHFITAPVAGTILRSENQLKIGDMAQPGQVLFMVGDATALQIDAEVDEEDILKVADGQEALIRADAFDQQVLRGTVSGITPHGDPIARTYRVYIALPDDTPLVSGMTTEINIVVRREENALLVPLSAITGGAVWVVEDGRTQLRPVTLGAVGNMEAEILTGLSEDDIIVVNSAAGIAEGRRVRPDARDRE
ncbi:efflux RND transporter periplasmic adaptor subunit [uncultured Parvibaculum sp.]|uniref:efflux RND transporter periplasmic adaptor subunit n=1 Tax=uncultured Parvibaculum sp. TaxID=291828 RepID=UPI0030DA8F5E